MCRVNRSTTNHLQPPTNDNHIHASYLATRTWCGQFLEHMRIGIFVRQLARAMVVQPPLFSGHLINVTRGSRSGPRQAGHRRHLEIRERLARAFRTPNGHKFPLLGTWWWWGNTGGVVLLQDVFKHLFFFFCHTGCFFDRWSGTHTYSFLY